MSPNAMTDSDAPTEGNYARTATAAPPPGPAEPRLLKLVEAIHATPQRMVMAYAGAGTQALARLHAVGGSSRTVLEAVDVYADRSMVEWVGFTPRHFTTRRVARAMAERAWRRARHLTAGRRLTANVRREGAPAGGRQVPFPVFGLGCTAAIATDRPKRGEHRVVVAVRDALGAASYTLTLEKGARDRAAEEAQAAQVILRAVADACGVLGQPALPLVESERLEVAFEPASLLAELGSGGRPYVVALEDGTLASALPRGAEHGGRGAGAHASRSRVVMLSGAFNPVHGGHLELARVAAGLVGDGGGEPVFELPLVNADKSPIDLFEGWRRAQQFSGRAPLALTREPLFVGKAELFPGSVFVIGADTAERIVDPRFYGGEDAGVRQALDRVNAAGVRFLVAARRVDGAVVTLRDIAVPEGYGDLFEAIPEEAFRQDVSSTQIRGGWDEGG